ncbi:MAG TPA: GlsB/YeaQ/YmgE family stress response membrane protein [Myxococcota bacterium]|nr:GlsB/YeaQ/YmgE family stress response membrane protein [Myxococcota bacterium]
MGVLLVWAVIGLVIGAIAKAIMPGADGSGIVITSILGIAGAVVGGAIASAVGLGSFTGFTVGSLVIAVLGALALLFVYRMVRAT